MIRNITLTVCFMLVTAVLYAANKEQERLENCGVVMQEIMNVPDNIPQDVMEKAECVIVFPSVLKAAFVVGASYGRGAMVCRTGERFRGPWQCTHSKAAVLDSKSADRLRTSCCL